MIGEPVRFSPRACPEITLEGELLGSNGPPCVVSHPHPLAGGNMHHPVTEALWRAAGSAGFRALRYNFRGVGASTGKLTSKSPLATADLGGAVDFLGGGPVHAIGYSYGARVTLHAILAGESIRRAVLAGLPTRLPTTLTNMSNLLLGRTLKEEENEGTPDLELLDEARVPLRLIAGSLDPLVDTDAMLDRGVEPVIIEGVNHFFSRRRGNQSGSPEDLALLARHALDFLGA